LLTVINKPEGLQDNNPVRSAGVKDPSEIIPAQAHQLATGTRNKCAGKNRVSFEKSRYRGFIIRD
jgi:hypothetical protein